MKEPTDISRRRFLIGAGCALGAGAVTCSGLGLWAARAPEIEFAQSDCGDTDGDNRILVAYASRAGSTGEVAQAIAEVLCQENLAVDLRLARDVADVSAYRAVVVGSAIYMGRWMSEAADLLEAHREALSKIRVACFTVCLTLKDDTEENRRTVSAYLDPVRERVPQVRPVDVGLFAGKLQGDNLSALYRLIVKAMDFPEGDYRDWTSIRAWAQKLPRLLGCA
ncbi:MAG: flavodoxin [Ardenticatenales bacterium]|nr:flavodoxin [Ardenticatenales bacterium]